MKYKVDKSGHCIMPEGIQTIENYEFAFASDITDIEIPDSVTSIGDGAFEGCVALNSIQVADDNQFYKSVDNCLLSKDGLSLILGCNASIIPNSVTSIGKYAFAGSNLIAITIHEKNPLKAFLLIQNAGFIKEHITLNVPIGTGYAYRHTPFFAKFKMIIAKVR
ncbi:MAG TPA: leucine-rich repeat protein [Candidatus Cryptobacteroides excrementigallinarum]|nr:leucine-rich repeat protein [Candidatus Cryptobacteroides excrementigallinarum]